MFLIIDVGGTFIKSGIYNKDNERISEDVVKTNKTSFELFMSQIIQIGRKCESLYGSIDGLGLSLPGNVDNEQGIVKNYGTMNILHERPLKAMLASVFSCPIVMENDGKAATLGEHWEGNLKGIGNGMVMTLGSGVGGGLIFNHLLYKGSHFVAGELSYVRQNKLSDSGLERDYFGLKGSAVIMMNKMRLINDLEETASGEVVFDYIHPENKESWDYFSSYCLGIAHEIIDIQCLLDLERILIGGGISVQPLLINTINEKITDIFITNAPLKNKPVVMTTKFGNQSSQMGMLSLLRKKEGR